MKLAIDVGNTLVKLAVFDQNKLLSLNKYEELTELTVRELFLTYPNIKSAIIASVRDIPDEFNTLISGRVPMIMLSHKTPLPIKIDYNSPETLGVDRISAVVAARNLYPGKNLLVIESGTCITYDFIDVDGIYHGGSISPGMEMRFTALHNFTDKLPLIRPEKDPQLTGNTTEASIRSGVINGLIAEIQGIISRYESNYENLTIILSGGNLDYFDKNLKNNIFAVPNLVIKGLKIILDFNDKN
ncbi:MAG: type III pantothenate kinase [Bacteroidota bacterium]